MTSLQLLYIDLKLPSMALRIQNHANYLSYSQNRVKAWRQKYPLDRNELNNLIFTEKYAKIKQQALKIMSENRHIFKHGDIQQMTRQQERDNAVAMLFVFHQLRKKHVFDPQKYAEDPHALCITAHATYNFDPGFSVKNDITFFLYFKTLYAYGTSEIHKDIIRKALKVEHIGCFGLTEAGHGSNARNVQVQAVYDHQSKQFIITTPQNIDMKFWIGAAAQLATMSVIWAKLIINGKDHGPHPFIVPLRDPKTHQPYKGVTIGDCGPKNGCQLIDNGFLIFKNHRIPKAYLLDKLSTVDQQGNFVPYIENPEKRFGTFMGPLSYGRAFVAFNSNAAGAAALAIAIRFCCERRQFTNPLQKKETLLIDYPMMKYRLMPLLAQTLVYYFGGAHIIRSYDQKINQVMDPKNKIIQQMHAVSASLKAKSSEFYNNLLTQCRQALGGHGYSVHSRLGRLYHDQDINLTWEGDNTMLLQQTTKYILKASRKLGKGKTFEHNTLYFINDQIELPESITIEDLRDLSFYESIIQKKIQEGTQEIINAMMNYKGEGLTDIEVWNKAQSHYGKQLALSFGDLYYYHESMRALKESTYQTGKVIKKSIQLWMLNTLQKEKWGDLHTRKLIQQELVQLCEWLTPRSISILDSIAQPPEIIGSVFADENGNGMTGYINKIFTNKNTFKSYDWYDNIPVLRKQTRENPYRTKSSI